MATHLILAPHHDDAEFGLGTTIQNWIENSDTVHVAIAAWGGYRRADGGVVTGDVRAGETLASMRLLGVENWSMVEWFQENKALAADYGALVGAIEAMVMKVPADNTYVCLPSFNQDHRVLFDCAVTAFRPGGAKGNLYAYEYPGNQHMYPPPEFGRRYHTASTAQADKKHQALLAHKSQFEGRDGGVTAIAAMSLGQLRGSEIGDPFAEVTYVIKEIV